MQVISVVVARRQRIGAHHDAALDFRAKAFSAGTLVKVGQVFRVFAAVAETHAVEARQVGRGLSRRDDVVGRDCVLQVWQADFLDDRTEFFQLLDAFMHQLRDTRVQACAEILFRYANTQALERGIEAGGVVRNRLVDAGRVLRVEAGHALQQQCAIFGGARHWPCLIEA